MILRAALSLLASAWLLACAHPDAAEDPVWNKQPCDHCHMVLSDPRFAAQLVTRDGQRLYFDDVGCMAAYIHDHAPAVLHAWANDGKTWLDATTARYSTGAKTPMDYGFAVSAHGTLDFDAVQRAVAEKSVPKGTP